MNSSFVFEPGALDTPLVMFAAIDSPAMAATESAVSILGSAWIDAGPFNPTEFDGYELSWAPLEVDEWTLIEESTTQASHDTLAAWATSGMAPGDYRLRLTIRDDTGDSLIAPGTITLYDCCIDLSGVLGEDLLELTWTACIVAEAYWVYGAADLMFFEPGLGPAYTHRLDTVGADTTSWSSSNGLGNPNENLTYLVIGVNASEQELCRSNRFAEGNFALP